MFEGWLAAAKDGDEQGLTVLYRAVHPRLKRFLAARAPTWAEDIASETWISVTAVA